MCSLAISRGKKEVELLLKKEKCLSLTLFGSVARGDERAFSDVDVLVLVRHKKDLVVVRSTIKARWQELVLEFGNVISPYLITAQDFVRRTSLQDPLLQNILSEGKVWYGRKLEEILRVAA